MRESLATLVSQTANGVVDLLAANIPSNVMHALELEQPGPEFESPKEPSETRDAPWGYQLCPHSSRRITHPRMHLFAVAGLVLTGALVVYTAALHMGFLGSEEAAAALLSTTNQTLPWSNITKPAPSPPNSNSPALDYSNGTLEFSPVVSIPSPDLSNINPPPNSTVDANSPALDSPNGTNESSPTGPEFSNINPPPDSSVGSDSSALNSTHVTDEFPPQGPASSDVNPPPDSSVVANSSALNSTHVTDEFSPQGAASSDVNPPPESSVVANSSALDYTVGTDEFSPETSNPHPESPDKAARVHYQNMSETWHTMSDKELLRKATSQEVRGDARAGKLAFLVMARGPLPFAPLWERFFRGHEESYSVFVHAHPDFVPSWASSSPFFGRFVPSKVVQWGRLSVYEAERRLLGNALLDPTNAWFLLLSESCIPVFSFPDTYAYFNNSPGVSFIESYKDSSRLGQGRLYRGRYKSMAPEVTASNFRKGSQWFQITRDLALMAARDSPEYTKFEKYFCAIHAVCYIDEHFMATLAWIVRPTAIAFRTLTFYTFRGKSPHPKTFTKADTTQNLIRWFREGHNCTYNGQVTSICYLFVRKYSPDALEALLDLAGSVMGIP